LFFEPDDVSVRHAAKALVLSGAKMERVQCGRVPETLMTVK